MRTSLNICTLAMIATVLGAGSMADAVQKFEWENDATGITSPVSFNGVNKDMDFTSRLSSSHDQEMTNDGIGWTFSNGAAHVLGAWGAPGAASEMVFAGTGITARVLKYDGANAIDWQILKANGAVVKSGSVDLKTAAANFDIVAATANELPYGLYKFQIVAKSTTAGGSGLAIIDYTEVADNGIKRAEETSPYASFTGTWGLSDANGMPSNGNMYWSSTAGAKVTLQFRGKDIAVVNPFSDTWFGGLGTFTWSIDGGAKTGTVNLSQNRYAGFPDTRVSTILADDLAPDAIHTLELTVGDTGKVVLIDAFDTSGNFVTDRIECEESNSPVSFNGVNKDHDFVAQFSTSHWSPDWKNADLGWSFSNGWARVISDVWADPGLACDMNFAGSVITVRMLAYAGGTSNVAWQLLGTDGAVAQSGTQNLNGGPANIDLTVTTPASGLWTLRLMPNAKESHVAIVDYFKVADNSMNRMESDDSRILKSVSWVNNTVDESYTCQPSAGSWMQNDAANATMTVQFEGTGVAVIAPCNPNYGILAYNIDNGTKTGMIDLSASRFAPADFTDMRASHIIAKGLSAGAHTMTLTAVENKPVFVDAFDTNGNWLEYNANVSDWSQF